MALWKRIKSSKSVPSGARPFQILLCKRFLFVMASPLGRVGVALLHMSRHARANDATARYIRNAHVHCFIALHVVIVA